MATKKSRWAFVVLATWLFAMVCAFWWFQFRNVGVYSEHWASFSGEALLDSALTGTRDRPLVLHFVDPDCPCSRFSYPHIEGLETRFAGDAYFVNSRPESVSEGGSNSEAKVSYPDLNVPAGPAVAIWARNGRLAYFGPYSGGAVCGEGADFVAATLEELAEGRNPQWINHEVVGCFCPWPKNLDKVES